MNIEIFVATHKKVDYSLPDHCRMIQVNAEKNGSWEGYLHDNDPADNISLKNESYCELTAFYALWKLCKADIKGLFHYRRFLTGEDEICLRNETLMSEVGKRDIGWIKKHIIKTGQIERYLEDADIIVPLDNMPYPATAFEDIQRFVYPEDVRKMIESVEKLEPDYVTDLWEILLSTNISYCNMLIASGAVVDGYCEWLFRIIEDVERKVDLEGYDASHKRIFGYYSEVLLNVYIKHNHLKPKYVYMVSLSDNSGKKKLKYASRLMANRFLAATGVYPRYVNPLWEARYRYLKASYKDDAVSYPENPEEASFNMRVWKGSNIRETKKAGYTVVMGKFGNIKIADVFVYDPSALEDFVQYADAKRSKSRFGQMIAYRIWPKAELSPEEISMLREKGFLVDRA